MRSPLSKRNATEADHINRKSRYAEAPMAPERTDGRCRWCGGPKNIAAVCTAGCFDFPVLPLRCQECKRNFATGQRNALLCHGCSQSEQAAFVQAHASDFTAPARTFWGRESERVNS